jgi:hypothetical protein
MQDQSKRKDMEKKLKKRAKGEQKSFWELGWSMHVCISQVCAFVPGCHSDEVFDLMF